MTAPRCPTCGQEVVCGLCSRTDVAIYRFVDGSAGLYCPTHAPKEDPVDGGRIVFHEVVT